MSKPPSLESLAFRMRCDLDIKDRRYRRKIVENVFVGSEAIGYLLVQKVAGSRADALHIMQEMVKQDLVRSVDRDSKFNDSRNFYRFTQDDDSVPQFMKRRSSSRSGDRKSPSRSSSTPVDRATWFISPHVSHNSIVMNFQIAEALQAACTSGDPVVQMQIVEHIRKAIVAEIQPRAPHWLLTKQQNRSSGQDRQVQVYRRRMEGNFQVCKTVGHVNVPPREFVIGFIDFERRKNWEALFDIGYIVEELPGIIPLYPLAGQTKWDAKEVKKKTGLDFSARIIYRTTRSPSGLVAPRDVCSFQDCFVTPDGTHIVYEISVRHKDVPDEAKGFVRGEVFALVHCAQPIPTDPTSSRLILVTQFDSKGKLPSWLADMVIDSLQVRNFEELKALRIPKELQDVPLDKALTKDSGTGVGIADFELLTVLGRGGFGKVLQVRHRQTQIIYAMKVLTKLELVAKEQVERTQVERSILAAVHHPFIVQLAYAFQSELKLYMVMEFVQGGDFFALIRSNGPISESRSQLYMAELALALDHLHSLDVIYRDLKPENVLLAADGHVKLTDFGLSHLFEPTSESPNPDMSDQTTNVSPQVTYSFCGTERYMAPEMLLQLGHGKGVDWWCLGIVACEILTTRHPFDSGNHFQTLRNIVSQEPRIHGQLSPQALSVVHGLLARNPAERLGSRTGLGDLKEHPFFAGVQWDDILAKKITPEYVPAVKSSTDTSNFEEVFTKQEIDEDVEDKTSEGTLSTDDEGGEKRMFNFFTGWVGAARSGSDNTATPAASTAPPPADDKQNPRLKNFSFANPHVQQHNSN